MRFRDRCPRAHDLGNQFALFPDQENDPPIGFDVLEDQVHDHFHHLVDAEAAAEGGAELVEDFEVGHRDGSRFGNGEDHGIVGGGDGVHDGAVHAGFGAGEGDVTAAGAGDAGLGAEDHEGSADANLVSELQGIAVVDAGPVDVAAVGAAHVFQDPFALIGEELGMAAAHRVVGDGKLAALAADQHGGVGELESASLVGAL